MPHFPYKTYTIFMLDLKLCQVNAPLSPYVLNNIATCVIACLTKRPNLLQNVLKYLLYGFDNNNIFSILHDDRERQKNNKI